MDERIYQVSLETPTGKKQIQVKATEHILDAAQAAGLSLPFICRQGRCLTCAGSLLSAGKFDPSDADMYFPEDRTAGFILLCTAKPESDLLIRTQQELEMRRHRLDLRLPAPYS